MRFQKSSVFPKWYTILGGTSDDLKRCTDKTVTNMESRSEEIAPFSNLFHSDYIKEKEPVGCWYVSTLLQQLLISFSTKREEVLSSEPPAGSGTLLPLYSFLPVNFVLWLMTLVFHVWPGWQVSFENKSVFHEEKSYFGKVIKCIIRTRVYVT